MPEALVDVIKNKLREAIKQNFAVNVESIASEIPPRTELGDLAFPICFELAKQMKATTGQKVNPRQLAEKLVPIMRDADPRISKVEIAGPGYLNFFYDRAAYLKSATAQDSLTPTVSKAESESGKIIVEHSSINPNKAAHIGHLRNAVLGDTIVRMFRGLGETVEIENYIDNTGVQVADVVVGFKYMEGKTLAEIKQIQGKFDYYCWDLYAKVGQWYEESKDRKEFRTRTLHELEESNNETSEMAEYIATTIIRYHLDTMARLGIKYEVLPRESDILHLHFWNYAFERLKESGAIVFETEGRNKGCWVMKAENTEAQKASDESAEESEFDPDKVIVKSNGIVTYVGKDIAFTLWKLGRLGMDFYYRPFYEYKDGATKSVAWISTSDKNEDVREARPTFGNGVVFYNVIDVGQSYTQKNVLDATRRIDPDPRVERSAHLSYEKVTLTPAAARDMGIDLSEEDQARTYVSMSGRKGLGVKIDDLIDRMEEDALAEVKQRHPDASDSDHQRIAHSLAAGALRYFLMKYTRTSVIAFDFDEALAFEGETGVYIQNAAVRIGSIFRKLSEANIKADGALDNVADARLNELLSGSDGDDWWSLIYLASRLREITEQAVSTLEPAFVAKFAFQLAQRFNVFYQKYRIVSETDEAKRGLLITIASYVRTQLIAALGLLGIEVPEKM